MSSDEKRSKLKRRIITALRDLLLWAVLLPLFLIQNSRHPWSFYARLVITAFVVSVGLARIVISFRNERKWGFTSQVFFLTAWLLAVLGAFWYGPLMVLGLLLMLASKIPAVVSYLRGVFASLAKSYRQMSKEV